MNNRNSFLKTLLALLYGMALPVLLVPTDIRAQSEIADLDQLQAIKNDLAASYVLTVNLDVSPTVNWNAGQGFEPIGDEATPFTGSFDGQGHTISNLYINRLAEDEVGLFGYTGTGATVQNVTITGATVMGNDDTGIMAGYNKGLITNTYCVGMVSGSFYAGGLVGYNRLGAVVNSRSTAAVTGTAYVGGLVGANELGTVNGSHSAGEVRGAGIVGGLVGVGDGSIVNSYSTAMVSATVEIGQAGGLMGWNDMGSIHESYSSGTVSGPLQVGGLVGYNDGSVSRSYSKGNVTGIAGVGGLVGYNDLGSVNKSYSTSKVSGMDYVGGLVGINDYGSISESYSSGPVTGTYSVGGLVGVNADTIESSYSASPVSGTEHVGGLAGISENMIRNCYSTGAVAGAVTTGGFLGDNDGGTVDGSYWDKQTSGLATGVASGVGSGAAGKTTAEMMTQATFSGWNFTSLWGIIENVTYPFFQWGEDVSVTTGEDVMYTFRADDFLSVGIMHKIKITSLPAPGSLERDGAAVVIDQEIGRADIDDGKLEFIPIENENAAPYAQFQFTVHDGNQLLMDTSTMTINVTAVNDAPANTVPGPQTTPADTGLVFSAANGNPLSVSDIDAGANDMLVILSAENGTLTLGGTGGLTFSGGDGTLDAAMSFTGSIADINTTLNGLTFQPSTGYAGSASVTIMSNDQGFTGSGGAFITTDTTAITVTPNMPVVVTGDVSVIAESQSAAAGGYVSSDGGSAVTARGVCWSTTENPITADSTTSDGTGTGVFTSTLTGLIPGTTYYVRAYATNSQGTAYGSSKTFIAASPPTTTTSGGGGGGTSSVMLSVSLEPSGAGMVNGGDISCPEACTARIKKGTLVSLEAVPEEGYNFIVWLGCSEQDGDTCTINMTGNTDVTAYFAPSPQTSTTTAPPTTTTTSQPTTTIPATTTTVQPTTTIPAATTTTTAPTGPVITAIEPEIFKCGWLLPRLVFFSVAASEPFTPEDAWAVDIGSAITPFLCVPVDSSMYILGIVWPNTAGTCDLSIGECTGGQIEIEYDELP